MCHPWVPLPSLGVVGPVHRLAEAANGQERMEQRDALPDAPAWSFGAVASGMVGSQHRTAALQRETEAESLGAKAEPCFAEGGKNRESSNGATSTPTIQQRFAAPGRAPWHETGLLLGALSCMLNTPAPCRILQPSAPRCCRGGGEPAFRLPERGGEAGKQRDGALLLRTRSWGSVLPPEPSQLVHGESCCAHVCCCSALAAAALPLAGMCKPRRHFLPTPWVSVCLYFCSLSVSDVVPGWGLQMPVPCLT